MGKELNCYALHQFIMNHCTSNEEFEQNGVS